ncbi:MAG: hypothetical protein ACYC9Y_09830 [Candidatus Methylomirabilia bacterium]
MAKAKKVPGVIDGWKYENDWFADRYDPTPTAAKILLSTCNSVGGR